MYYATTCGLPPSHRTACSPLCCSLCFFLSLFFWPFFQHPSLLRSELQPLLAKLSAGNSFTFFRTFLPQTMDPRACGITELTCGQGQTLQHAGHDYQQLSLRPKPKDNKDNINMQTNMWRICMKAGIYPICVLYIKYVCGQLFLNKVFKC